MAYVLLFCLFAILALLSALAARAGYRGEVCDSWIGQDVPDAARSDPALRARADALVAHWCTGCAVLSLAALVPLGTLAFGEGRELSLPGLALFAVYALAVTIIGGYPLEKLKRLG